MNTFTVDDASDHQTLTEAIIHHPCTIFILRKRAKTMFSEVCAQMLDHQQALEFMDKWPIIKGLRCGSWDEGDPNYLGLFAGRVWFGDKQ